MANDKLLAASQKDKFIINFSQFYVMLLRITQVCVWIYTVYTIILLYCYTVILLYILLYTVIYTVLVFTVIYTVYTSPSPHSIHYTHIRIYAYTHIHIYTYTQLHNATLPTIGRLDLFRLHTFFIRHNYCLLIPNTHTHIPIYPYTHIPISHVPMYPCTHTHLDRLLRPVPVRRHTGV
jgi:hypothetical protein